MPETAPKKLKIMAHACDGVGHLNALCGMLESLQKRGHQIIVLSSEGFKGKFVKYGFEEILLIEKPKQWGGKPAAADAGAAPENPIKKMAMMLKSSGMLSSKTPLEKLKGEDNTGAFLKSIYDNVVEFNPQIAEHIKSLKPDLFIVDHFIVPPALPLSGVPWIFLFSGNPLGMYKSDKLPPFGGGFPTDADPATWKEFKELQDGKMLAKFVKLQQDINQEFNYTPPEGDDDIGFMGKPKYLSIYGYPEELDYTDIVPMPEKFARVDAYCREIVEPFELPEKFAKRPGKMIYVSLGSMGSVDVDLIQRITNSVANTEHKYIVSKGPLGDEYELPENCYGENFLPQTRIIPMCDLVITHGGNNTITETFSMGKPMIVMPLFADQFDNAQRVYEKGYGLRMEPYTFEPHQLIENINKLLNDKALIAKCQAAAKRIANSKSKDLVCKQIEEVVEKAKNGLL